MLCAFHVCHSNHYSCENQGREQAHMDQEREQEVERAKMGLLRAVMETKRGAQVSSDQRAAIEEAMVRCYLTITIVSIHMSRSHICTQSR